MGFELHQHSPYSSDLAPNDYYLFPNLKGWLCDRRFESNEEVEWGTNGYFGGFDKSYYLEGIEKLKDRWARIIIPEFTTFVRQFLGANKKFTTFQVLSKIQFLCMGC